MSYHGILYTTSENELGFRLLRQQNASIIEAVVKMLYYAVLHLSLMVKKRPLNPKPETLNPNPKP